jgi:hypothetical protein
MKNLILLFLFLSTLVYGQLEIKKEVEQKPISSVNGISIYKTEKENITIYSFCYINQKYETLKEYKCFVFNDISESYNNLYKSILEGFKTPKDDISFNVEEEKIIVNYDKNFGLVTMYFINVDLISNQIVGYSPSLTEKSFKKLFGK